MEDRLNYYVLTILSNSSLTFANANSAFYRCVPFASRFTLMNIDSTKLHHDLNSNNTFTSEFTRSLTKSRIATID